MQSQQDRLERVTSSSVRQLGCLSEEMEEAGDIETALWNKRNPTEASAERIKTSLEQRVRTLALPRAIVYMYRRQQ